MEKAKIRKMKLTRATRHRCFSCSSETRHTFLINISKNTDNNRKDFTTELLSNGKKQMEIIEPKCNNGK